MWVIIILTKIGNLKFLKNRTFKKWYFYSSKKDQLYTILYHIFFHKGFFDKNIKIFLKNILKKNRPFLSQKRNIQTS